MIVKRIIQQFHVEISGTKAVFTENNFVGLICERGVKRKRAKMAFIMQLFMNFHPIISQSVNIYISTIN